MFVKLRNISVLLAAALLLTLVTTTLSFAQGPDPKKGQLTSQQKALVEAKERVIAQAQLRAKPEPDGSFVNPPQPVRQFVNRVGMTKNDLLTRLAIVEANDLAWIERVGGPEAARQKRAQFEVERRRLMALPDGTIELEISGVETGEHSISFSSMTWDSSNPKDPVNVIFYRVGSAADVNYDLKNWTRIRWQDTGCNSTQWVYIWDSAHTGGWNGWRENQYPMASNSVCWPGERDHLRLFQGFVQDSHSPSYGIWAVTAVHHDDYWHSCTNDWEGPEARLRSAFLDNNGQPLWFVGAVWSADIGNAGNYQCAYNDGRAQYLELLY